MRYLKTAIHKAKCKTLGKSRISIFKSFKNVIANTARWYTPHLKCDLV